MSKIIDMDCRILKVPTDKHISDSIHSTEFIEVVTCRITTANGIEGTGFTYTIGTGGLSIKMFLDGYIRKSIIGQESSDINGIWNNLWWMSQPVGRGGITEHAIAAIDIALWDIKCIEAGKPLYWMLGGSSNPVRLYETNSGWLHYTEEELVESATRVMKAGFYGFKIKVGKSFDEDMHRLRAVMDAVGDKIAVMADANQAWGYPGGVRRAKMMENLGIAWIEEPFPADDIESYRKLSMVSGIPVAAGETIFTKYEFMKYINAGLSICQPDVCRTGGISEWLQIASLCTANSVMVAPHFVMQLHAPLVSSITNGLYVEYIPWMEKIFSEKPRIENGMIYPSTRPGIGVQFSPLAVERYSSEYM
jgi:L-alanine-DL-glutamate epimerase-like enolase superfamily enzyme